MRLLLLFSLLSAFLHVSSQAEINICALVEEAMYCTCDVSSYNDAHQVSCSVARKVQHEDILWTGFQHQKNIQILTLAKLDFVPSPVIRSLQNLKGFVMRDSSLDTLWPYTFVNMSHLESISMERNSIETLERYSVAYLPKLKELSLADNRIKKLSSETLYRLHVLEKLQLNGNNMTSIEDLAFVEMPNLLELHLNDNHLHSLTAKTFVGLRSLKRLYLFRNKLTALVDGVFSGTPALIELYLWTNHVAHVSPHAFDGLNHLQVLQLNGNRIKHLQDNVFKGTQNLESLHLAHNRLTTFQRELLVPLNILDKPKFQLHLKGNPLNCSCDLLWMTEISEKVLKSHAFGKELRHLKCKNFTIVKLTAEDLSCPEITTTTTTTTTSSSTRTQSTQQIPLIANIQLQVSTPHSDKDVLFADPAMNPNIGKPLHSPPVNGSVAKQHPVLSEVRSNLASMNGIFPLLIFFSTSCLAVV